jgi:hypothetical protein
VDGDRWSVVRKGRARLAVSAELGAKARVNGAWSAPASAFLRINLRLKRSEIVGTSRLSPGPSPGPNEVVDHSREYVRGLVHTNGLENFWSLLKRTLRGTYVAVEPFHMDQYLSEQVFRYNNRATKDNKITDSDRFAVAMCQVAGKRLTYAKLTGKDMDSVCHPEAGTGQEEPF